MSRSFSVRMLVVGEKDSLDIVTGNNVDEILFVVEIIDGQVGQTVGFVGFPVIVESGYLVLFAVAHPGLERNAPVVHAVNQQPAVALRDFGNDDIVSQHHAHTHTYQHHRGHQHVQQAPYQELPVGQHHAEHHDSHQGAVSRRRRRPDATTPLSVEWRMMLRYIRNR